MIFLESIEGNSLWRILRILWRILWLITENPLIIKGFWGCRGGADVVTSLWSVVPPDNRSRGRLSSWGYHNKKSKMLLKHHLTCFNPPAYVSKLTTLPHWNIKATLSCGFLLFLRCGRDSNPRPSAWQADILTNWTTAPIIKCAAKLSEFLIIQNIFFEKHKSKILIKY